MKQLAAVSMGLAAALLAAHSAAHHSSALFYDVQDRITVTGTVTDFKFSNPHAILHFVVTTEGGEEQQWTAETTSPSVLRRRGWSQQSFTPGEHVTLEGMPSLDGSWLMRITRAWREDGSEIGVPRGVND
ncbi:MAG TPA: DUF6152 family protein [Gammaproteobacteria bacterium]|nr:DUF6152 family protein [Gammaproteobacteria bacterium]